MHQTMSGVAVEQPLLASAPRGADERAHGDNKDSAPAATAAAGDEAGLDAGGRLLLAQALRGPAPGLHVCMCQCTSCRPRLHYRLLTLCRAPLLTLSVGAGA